jgi:uncharacterized surface protein with fasciclin (FAS1) repeats
MRRLVAGAAAVAVLVAGSATLASPAQAGTPQTLLGAISAADRYTSTEDSQGLDKFRWDQRNWYDYDILTAAVVADGTLVGAVTDPRTAVTLFAPNDRAFQLLARDLTGRWYWTERAVLKAIVGVVAAGKVDLTNVLTYHVVPGKFEKADVVPLIGTPIPTLNGDTFVVQPPNRWGFIEIRDNVDAFRNPYLVRTDIDAGNSVIHSISRVLIPTNVGG